MALAAASSVISHNRTVNSLAFPLPKHGNLVVNHHHHQRHSKLIFHSFSHPQYIYQCSNSRIVTPSCLAKTAVSDAQLQNSNLSRNAADNSKLLFACSFSIFLLNLEHVCDNNPLLRKSILETLISCPPPLFFFSRTS